MKYLLSAAVLSASLLVSSCSKDEVTPYNHPFFHINVDQKTAIEVLSNRKDTVDYKVYLSAELQFEPVDLTYEIAVGDGLKEGKDFELITKGNKLTFPQGIFERPIRIAWKDSPVDTTKTNTLKIKLIRNTKNYTIGMPGPDGLQRELVITRK